jgi:glycine dehydrogenase subunit 1
MGPQGMHEIGVGLLQRVRYAVRRLSGIDRIRCPVLDSPCFKEFLVDFSGTGKTVAEINAGLLARGIFGGHDVSAAFPEFGQCALFCVTEVHTQEDIDRLALSIREILT